MPTEVKLPRLGQGMDSGKILRWMATEGDDVDKGDDLYEVETEKVNIEVEAPTAGTLLKIVVGEGEEVPIGTVIAWVGESGEEIPDTPAPSNGAAGSAAAPAAESSTDEAPAATAQPAPAAEAAPAAPAARSTDDGRIKASPLARRMAREQNIDLASLQGSGPDGRIVARDIDAAQPLTAAAPAPATAGEAFEDVPLTSIRATIARRLGEAWQAPAFYLTVDVDMQAANEMREALVGATAEGAVRPTVSDILTRACAIALRQHPDMNVHFMGDAIRRFSVVHIGMAVATDAGLVVPVIRDAHARTVREIAGARKDIVDRARAGRLMPADMDGGTFTISNLGMMGIEEFTAVLNPPMAGILAVGETKDVPVVVGRKVEIRPRMKLTLGCDHRAVDGALGARFLQTLRGLLEQPLTMV